MYDSMQGLKWADECNVAYVYIMQMKIIAYISVVLTS